MPINEISSIYTPSIYGRTSFPLRHKLNPIFYKSFNSEDSDVIDLNRDIINIPNHFFKTGEPLKYEYTSIDTAVGISTSSPGAGGTISELPETVYPIVIDKDNIRIALGSTYAEANEYVDIVSLGIGTNHTLEAFKQNSKCLITINNIIQSPISIASTVKVLSYTQASLTVESLENIKTGTSLKINDEIVKVSAINYDTKTLSISRGSSVLGTDIIPFSASLTNSYVDVLSGNYNIVKDVIYFDEPPLEGRTIEYKVPVSDIIYENYSFNLFSEVLKTGDQVLVTWANPPQEIPLQKFYYLIENSENNFSFAETFSNAFNGTKVTFSNIASNEFPVSEFKVILFFPAEENSFNGRVFLRSNYDGNVVFDDVSEEFTGITSSFELKISGITTVGIKSDNGILLINNIFQYPGSDEAFSYVESGGSTFVNFVGFGTTGFTGKNYDVNVKGYPRGGIIVSYGTTSGRYYEPLKSYSNLPLSGSVSGIGASVSFETDVYGNVANFKFVNRGYNYKVGEILVPLNTTGLGTQVNDDKIHIKIDEVIKDTFNAWNVGILDKLDDLSSKVNGVRKTFSLTKNGQRVSLEADSENEIDLPYNLLVFINDVLQVPNTSYRFNGGSIITFTEPIPTGSNVKIYFYKGYTNDTVTSSNLSKLKEGDTLQLLQDIYNPPPNQQNKRIIKEFTSSDVLRTNVYDEIGLSEDSSQIRSITWTPQKTDLIIDGSFVSKSRIEQNSGITSFTQLISSGITTTPGTFNGITTSIIGINTNSGIGSLIQIGDYVESDYVGFGVTIVSIGSSAISISTESSSPSGINTSLLSIYRKS